MIRNEKREFIAIAAIAVLVLLAVMPAGVAAATTTIFTDDFSSGNFSKWCNGTFIPPNQYIDIDAGSARFKQDLGCLVACIDTSCMGNITLYYHRRTEGLVSGEYFEINYSTNGGSTWFTLEQVNNNTWASVTFNLSNLSAASNDNPNLQIRFMLHDVAKRAYLDNVTVTGTPMVSASALNVAKTVISSGTYYPGTNISYNITVCNLGDLTLTNVTLNDPKLGLVNIDLGALATGACNWTVRNYPVNQTDACRGWVNNTVNVSAKACNKTFYNQTSANVSVTYVSALSVRKEVISFGPYYQDDNITYNITVCNVGNLTLTNVTLNDPKLSLVNFDLGTLAPGECNSTERNHTVTAGDVCTGWVNNTANVSAIDYCSTTRYSEASANVNLSAIKPPVPIGEATDPNGLAKELYTTGEPVYAVGSGFAANKNVSIYIIPFQTPLIAGYDLEANKIVGPVNVTTDGTGNIALVLVWPNPTPGHYWMVFDDPNTKYDPDTDPTDDLTVTGKPVKLPLVTPLGIVALIGLLSMVALNTLVRKRRRQKR
jgi:uncharacterized protein (UPF0212 family)